MSKHSDADAKLHIGAQVRGRGKAIQKQRIVPTDNAAPQVPPKGTNSNNQYR